LLGLSLAFATRIDAQDLDTVRVSYVVTSQWATGFDGRLTIRNDSRRGIEDWRLALQLSPQITSIWNARIVSRSGDRYILGPVDASWDDGEIASGETVTIGFVAQGAATALPTNAFLNGAPVTLNQASPAPRPQSVRIMPAPTWPRTTVAPYVDATAWPPLNMAALAKELDVRRFRLGFVVAQSAADANPSWGGVRSASGSYRLQELNELRAHGGDAAIAFGGAAGTELALVTKSTAELAAKYKSVIDAYQASVVDFDIEGAALAHRESIGRRAEALQTLQSSMKAEGRSLEIWFTLPVTPNGLSGDALLVIRAALEHRVDIRGINVMAMDYGSALAPDPVGRMGAYAIEAARNLHDQLHKLYAGVGKPKESAELWRMIGITPMIGQNDVAGEVFQTRDASQVFEFAMKNHIGLLSFWSLNRDRPCERGQAAANPGCSGIAQRPYEFALIFQPFGARGDPSR
jgi:hypothetical protein